MSAEESVAMGRMSGVSPPSYDMYCACRVESDLACICAFEILLSIALARIRRAEVVRPASEAILSGSASLAPR